MQLLSRRRRRVLINITSLIDVLFLLLIFFAISTTFREQPGLNLALPEAQHGGLEQLAQELVVEVAPDRRIFLAGEEVPLDSLEARLQSILPSLAEKKLLLRADESVPHGLVVRAMDAAKAAGVETIVIATRLPEATP
ncbi:MAG: biopolymer transporter ExbD [candidate division KSB1 bacterium]|nr:biopolymer transporter ExbD [candidate division KSB1 bacterium]